MLTRAFQVWRKRDGRADGGGGDYKALTQRGMEQLRQLKQVEDYIYPLSADTDWLERSGLAGSSSELYALLLEFRALVQRWHGAALLPVDQIILTVAQDLFHEPVDLAIAHKLASVLRQAADHHPGWRLPELSEELETIAKNKRRFLGFSDDEIKFEPGKYRGRVVITTMHKAKGLEWDRVYLLSVNNYNFPFGKEYDEYHSEKWFIRDRLNLDAEALAQIKAALSRDEYEWYTEGEATSKARVDCVCERLRLLYVGITRARRELVMTWNTGKNGKSLQADPYLELQSFWENTLAQRE